MSGFREILLQRLFCIDQHKFSGPCARRLNDHLKDYIICDELTGDFGNRLEATSVGDCISFAQFAGGSAAASSNIAAASARHCFTVKLVTDSSSFGMIPPRVRLWPEFIF